MPTKEFKFINDNITDFQAIVDRERVVLYWDKLDSTTSMKSLIHNGSNISLTALVDIGDAAYAYNTFSVASSAGASAINDKYNNESIIFLDSKNIISLPKIVLDYASYQFTVDNIEYAIYNSSRFGLDYALDLIDDDNTHVNSTITYTTTAGNFEHKITAYNSATKTFTVSGSLDFNFLPGDSFILQYAYYPKLYVSIDNGETYDNGTDLLYSVSNIPTGTLLEGNYYYNKFKDANSTLLNTTDAKFYTGAYVTFLTGLNRGFSRKITAFDINTKEFTTEYFKYTIAQNDIFTINTYHLPLTNSIENYMFKMVLWNYNENNPIYGREIITYPALSAKNYLETLDNGYWDTNLNTNLYYIIQGITKDGHSRAEIETLFQRTDNSIDEVRENKLYTNFGKNFGFEKNPNNSYVRYRNSIKDLINGFRNTGTYEGLHNVVRAFSRITPTVDFISNTGWRLGVEPFRLGYGQTTINKTTNAIDSVVPYNTVSTTITSLASGSDTYNGDYLYFTSTPSGSPFNQAMYGALLPITDYEVSGGNSIFTIGASGISTPIPSGANFTVLDLNTNTNFGTIPYSDLALLFGVRILVYGPTLDDFDTSKLSELLAKVIPLHVNYLVSYQTKFVGESSWSVFNGIKTNLENKYETNILVPIENQLLEPNRLYDTITGTVTAVSTGALTTTFASSGFTDKYNYYKSKYVTFISGNNNGISKKVISYVNQNFVTEEFPYNISASDTFKIETIFYQTKYVTQTFDLQPDDFSVTFLDNLYTGSWFARKLDTAIVEKVYIEFSDDQLTFTKPRELLQNEDLNTIVSAVVTSVSSPTTTFAVSASTGSIISTVNDYYNNMAVRFSSGANSGESQVVSDYNGSSQTLTIAAFANSIIVGDTLQISVTDMKRYARMTMYHNYLFSDKDIEIESLIIKIL